MKFGKMFRMNDLIESNRIVFDRLVAENEEDIKYNGTYAEREMHRYQQISFSQDRKHDDAVFMGFDLHTMWGLYAERGCGVCLVFDKDKLRLGDRDYARNVEYENIIPADYGFRNKSKAGIKSEIWRRRDEIFSISEKNGNTNRSIVSFAEPGAKWMMNTWMYLTRCRLQFFVGTILCGKGSRFGLDVIIWTSGALTENYLCYRTNTV